MKVYQYEVGRDMSKYLLSVQAENNKDGLAKVHLLPKITNVTPIVLVGSLKGTLEDYIGEESMKAVLQRKKRIREQRTPYMKARDKRNKQ